MPRPKKRLPIVLLDVRWAPFRSLKLKYKLQGIYNAEYNGYGDSGTLNVTHHTDQSEQIEAQHELSELLLEVLSDLHGGWEIDEGSAGRIEISFDSGTIHWVHSENYMTTEDYRHDGAFLVD
jgi:hypothetical protein